MANNLKTSIVSRNAELDALAALANSGKLRIYDGSQPATPETAAGATLLAELTMNATAFGAAAATAAAGQGNGTGQITFAGSVSITGKSGSSFSSCGHNWAMPLRGSVPQVAVINPPKPLPQIRATSKALRREEDEAALLTLLA